MGIKKDPPSLQSGRKAFLPRYHPQFAGIPAQLLKAQTRSQSLTEPPGAPYFITSLRFRRQLMGEGPVLYPKRLTPFRSRCKGSLNKGQPNLCFWHIPAIIAYSTKICKCFLQKNSLTLFAWRFFAKMVLYTQSVHRERMLSVGEGLDPPLRVGFQLRRKYNDLQL